MRARRLVAAVATVAAVVLAGCTSPLPPAPSPGAGPLRIGTLVPSTGLMSSVGPAEAAGISLAVKDVDDAGGVLGQPMTVVEGDAGLRREGGIDIQAGGAKIEGWHRRGSNSRIS